MPPQRSYSGIDVPQLVWTIPVEPTSLDLSPLPTSDDSPPPLIDPSDSILFPPTILPSSPSLLHSSSISPSTTSPRKPTHSRKKPDDHIPRPPNAFILFRSSFIKGQHVPTEVETNHSTLSKIIGLTWKNLPNDERLFWHAKAKAALDEHKRKFPQYSFRPNQSRTKGGVASSGGGGGGRIGVGGGAGGAGADGIGTGASGEKRKVREVGPKDHKRCMKIAELLVEGKKGQALDKAVQEFDKHHVPEVITRFETPITARMFRKRSCSVPVVVGKGEEREKREQQQQQPSKRRKVRATSSQPTTDAPAPAPAFATETPIPLPSSQHQHHPLPKIETQINFMSAFDPYPLSTASSPSFDFNTFSFDIHSPLSSSTPTYHQICDPLSPLSPLSPISPTHTPAISSSSAGAAAAPLSIDTSFLGLEDWNCPSPLSSDILNSSISSNSSSCGGSSMPATPCFTSDLDHLDLGLYEATFDLNAFEEDGLLVDESVFCRNGKGGVGVGVGVEDGVGVGVGIGAAQFLGTFMDQVNAMPLPAVSTISPSSIYPMSSTTHQQHQQPNITINPYTSCSHEVLHHHHHQQLMTSAQGQDHHHLQDHHQLHTAMLGDEEISEFMASIPGYAV